MANCGFNRGTVDRILIDLNENYNRNPRRNVAVNLQGNSPPSATEEIATIINRLRREGWTIGLET
jgi:DNA polymerase IIIc chi subunit